MRSSNKWLIDLSKDELLWAKNLYTLPSMVHFEYAQLKSLAEEGQVYGILLQCRDTYETILKIPVIMALVVIDGNPKFKDGSEYSAIMKAFLKSPMSMGSWNTLAGVIVNKKNKKLNLPNNLIQIIDITRRLYETEITSKGLKIVKWRNETIGHGALKFEDDVDYQEEIKTLLALLKEYFEELSVKGMYDSIYFQCGDNKLVANCYDKSAEHDLILHVAKSPYVVSNYINDCNLKWYLFESFYCNNNLVKYSSYIDGKNNTVQNKYFADLYEKHVLQGRKATAVAGIYTRAEDRMLENLNMPIDYVKPVELVELLKKQMHTLEMGVITVFMERGTGKSAFASHMSGLYYSESLLKNSFTRCYHVSHAGLRGVRDFITSINKGFQRSSNQEYDLLGDLKELTLESEKPAEDMAEFLNFYHDIYRKDYTILVIDGIDEITEQTEFILKYIPSKEMLEDGVFVVLMTRFIDEETVQGKSKKYIEKAAQLADGQLEIHRRDGINTELLERYIEKFEKEYEINKTVNIDKEALIKKSDYRVLYLRAHLAMKDQVDLDNTNESSFIESYMNYLLSFYGINQKQKLKEIAVSIALFPSISIKKYQEYLNCQEITYEFVGLFNDLLPLLTAVHLDGETVYEFADVAYNDFVIDEYQDVVKDVIDFFYESLKRHLDGYLKNGSDVRELWLNQTSDEKAFNKSLIFFSEGLLGIWHKSSDHIIVSKLFYESFDIIKLFEMMVSDEWADYGYGLYVKNEILSCIVESLYYGLKNGHNKECSFWVKKFNELLSEESFKTTFTVDDWRLRKMKEEISASNNFGKIVNYLFSNYTRVNDFSDWYWLFVPKSFDLGFSCKIIPIVKDLGDIDGYAEYMLRYIKHCCEQDLTRLISFGLIYKWALELLKEKLAPTNEEKVLNYLLDQAIEYDGEINGKSRKEIARECFGCIQEKKYKLTACNGDSSLLLKKLEEKNETIKDYLKEVHFAIQTLLKPQPLSDDEYELIDKVSCTIITSSSNREKNIIQKNVKKLHKAFYNRLCYERDNENLEKFCHKMINTIRVNFVNIIKSACREEDYINVIKEWAKSFESIVNKENRFTYILLSQLIMLIVKLLEDSGYENEALEILERYVYQYDIFGFLVSATLFCVNDNTVSNEKFETPGLVYCTDNALYLLKRLYEKDETYKVTKLLKTIEKSILTIEKLVKSLTEKDNLGMYDELLAKTDIQKYRFMFMKKELQINNEYDKSIETFPSKHMIILKNMLCNISRNSDFRKIAFHVEMLLEFYWLTRRWTDGEIYCKELLESLGAVDCLGDKIVEKCIRKEIGTIWECKRFFMFLNGKNVKRTKNYIPLKSSYSHLHFGLSGFDALYDVIYEFQYFYLSDVKKDLCYKKREWYQNLINICLHSYSAY